MVYWACTKIYLKILKRSFNIRNREYSLQYIKTIVASSDGSEKGELYVKKENIGRKPKDFK